MDDFFSFISKAVIIIPIFIFIFSLIFKFNQSKPKNIYSKISKTAFISPVPSIVEKIPIDLIGPWICHYQEGQKKYNLSIKNKKVILQIEENNQIKTYDLSPYIPYVEGLLKTNITNIQNMINQYSGQKIDVKKILDSCKKEE